MTEQQKIDALKALNEAWAYFTPAPVTPEPAQAYEDIPFAA